MESMPNEILLNIFEYLSASDLIALSTLCRVFNFVISDFKLVKKLHLNFRKLNGDESSIGNRRYVQLKIGTFMPSLHYPILQDIGIDLMNLSFKNLKLKLDLIRKILVGTPNVTKLSFDRVTLSDVPKVMKQPFPQLKNVNLSSTASDPRLYRVIRDCNFIEIAISQRADDGFYRFVELNRLLHSQIMLKHFSVDGLCKTSLFADDNLDKVKFCLESFSVTDSIFQRTIHLKTFIEAHAATLRKLQISKIKLCDFSTVLNKLNQLKSLSLATIDLGYLEPMLSVEELSIAGHKITEAALDKFPSVKLLKMTRVDKKSILDVLSRSMMWLEDVEVTECPIDCLNVPTIKRLSLKRVNFPSNFFKIHHKIEHLIIRNCSVVTNEVIKELAQNVQSLKSLILIKSGFFTNDSLLAIRDFCNSLTELRIEGQTDLDWKLLENRKELKIYIL